MLAQLLSRDGGSEQGINCPPELQELLTRVLVNGETGRIEWSRLSKLLDLADKSADKSGPDKPGPAGEGEGEKAQSTLLSQNKKDAFELVARFLMSDAGLFLKEPLIAEIADTIDELASLGEINLERVTRGLLRAPPGGKGPVQGDRVDVVMGIGEEVRRSLDKMQKGEGGGSGGGDGGGGGGGGAEVVFAAFTAWISEMRTDESKRSELGMVADAAGSVVREVAAQVVEKRGLRAVSGFWKGVGEVAAGRR